MISLVFIIVAIIIAIIDLARTAAKSMPGWGVLLLGVAMLLPHLWP